jgi:hypothetical protein
MKYILLLAAIRLVLCGAEIVINPADEKPCSAAAEEVL